MSKNMHTYTLTFTYIHRRVAQVVYFSIPVIAGYYIMEWATNKAKEEIQFDTDGSGRAGGVQVGDRALENMRISPNRPEQGQIAAQNHSLQSYLQSIQHKEQKKEDR